MRRPRSRSPRAYARETADFRSRSSTRVTELFVGLVERAAIPGEARKNGPRAITRGRRSIGRRARRAAASAATTSPRRRAISKETARTSGVCSFGGGDRGERPPESRRGAEGRREIDGQRRRRTAVGHLALGACHRRRVRSRSKEGTCQREDQLVARRPATPPRAMQFGQRP